MGLEFRCCKILEDRSYINQGQNSDMGEWGYQKRPNFLRLLWTAPSQLVLRGYFGPIFFHLSKNNIKTLLLQIIWLLLFKFQFEFVQEKNWNFKNYRRYGDIIRGW